MKIKEQINHWIKITKKNSVNHSGKYSLQHIDTALYNDLFIFTSSKTKIIIFRTVKCGKHKIKWKTEMFLPCCAFFWIYGCNSLVRFFSYPFCVISPVEKRKLKNIFKLNFFILFKSICWDNIKTERQTNITILWKIKRNVAFSFHNFLTLNGIIFHYLNKFFFINLRLISHTLHWNFLNFKYEFILKFKYNLQI